MRLLMVSALPPARSDLGALEAAASTAGHEVHAVRGEGARGEAIAAARIGKEALLRRPAAALLEVSPWVSASAAALAAARIPYVLWAPRGALEDLAGPRDLLDNALRGACGGAAAVIVGADAVAEQLARHAGVEDMELLSAGLDLEDLPLGDRAEARAALRLPEGPRVLGLVGPLGPETGLELLSLAHRTLAGVTLLVAGDGPSESAIFAMGGATRPSSPVVHVGPLAPATRVVTACAADVTLALDTRTLSEESWRLAALGRRQVAFDVPGTDAVAALYPEHRTVFATPEHPEALRQVLAAALDEEAAQGPLPADAVQAARAALDVGTRWSRLVERVVQCA